MAMETVPDIGMNVYPQLMAMQTIGGHGGLNPAPSVMNHQTAQDIG